MKQSLILGLMILLNACGVPELSTPAPTPEAIHVVYPASLERWADRITGCASTNPLIGLYFTQAPTLDTNFDMNVVLLELGEPSQIDAASYLSQVGLEQITVIVNQDNDLSQISTSLLQSIYSGQTTSWKNDSGQRIQVWVLPNGDPVRKHFDQAIMQSNPLTSEAMLAPDPEAMLEAISGDNNSIGYLPGSMLSSSNLNLVDKVKIVQLDSSLQEELHQPVIALTHIEPEGLMRELLICLQDAVP
jgi:hypothetical protein